MTRLDASAGDAIPKNEPNVKADAARRLAMDLRIWGRWVRAGLRARLPGKGSLGLINDGAGH